MAKFYGNVGFVRTYEKPDDPGIWVADTLEKKYYGDVTKQTRRWEKGESLNDNINVSVQISIVADKFATENLYAMKYVEYLGVKWKITDVTPQYPRLLLSIGGIYNEQP